MGKKMTERENLVHSTPLSFIEGRGYCIRLADIPEPYRLEFSTDSIGSTIEIIDGDEVHFLNDWFKWLEIRFNGPAGLDRRQRRH